MKLKTYLELHEAPIRAGIDETEIYAFEQKNNIKLPSDFRDFLKLCDGFIDYEKDDDGFRFWQLSETCLVSNYDNGKYKIENPEDYLIFCDYLDFSWAYAFNVFNGKVLIIGLDKEKPPVISENFSDFINKYISGDNILYAA
ncbi:MAG: SMI1/KNR4 family protein [Pseudomonadota bacterium]